MPAATSKMPRIIESSSYQYIQCLKTVKHKRKERFKLKFIKLKRYKNFKERRERWRERETVRERFTQTEGER